MDSSNAENSNGVIAIKQEPIDWRHDSSADSTADSVIDLTDSDEEIDGTRPELYVQVS